MKNENHPIDEFTKHERAVTPHELLAEIKPLLDDYFVGQISLDGRGITYLLPNGQKFLLSVEEVV